MDCSKALVFLVVFFLFFPKMGKSQLLELTEQVKYDTSYITAYKDELTTRVFLSRKQSGSAPPITDHRPCAKYNSCP